MIPDKTKNILKLLAIPLLIIDETNSNSVKGYGTCFITIYKQNKLLLTTAHNVRGHLKECCIEIGVDLPHKRMVLHIIDPYIFGNQIDRNNKKEEEYDLAICLLNEKVFPLDIELDSNENICKSTKKTEIHTNFQNDPILNGQYIFSGFSNTDLVRNNPNSVMRLY